MAVTLDSPKLRKLSRTQLQSLAKREIVRAVGKTEDIIRRLIQKHPHGVPIPQDTERPSTSSASQQRNATDPDALPGRPAAKQDVLRIRIPPLNKASRSDQDGEDTTRNAPPAPQAQTPDEQIDEEAEVDAEDEYGYPTGAPTHYMVVDSLRKFTTLTNALPFMETRIAENRCLLQRAQTLLEKATPDARELTVTREYLETFLLAKMKDKRELWDGTGRMNKRDRKIRMEWLRAERKAESEKKWKEANEYNAEHGLELEPFSAFTLESDEEVIESLQTTPTGSRHGSPKRQREDSVDAEESDGDASHDESRRKKSRSL